MIQRIQSLYLLVATLLQSLLFVLPFATAEKTAEGPFVDGDLDLYDNVILLSVLIVAATFSLICIFLFKNRKLQMNISLGVVVLSVILTTLAAYFTFSSAVAASIGIGLFIPIIAIVFSFLAYRGIKSDDDLVKSSNRLR
jgi:O-antigen/teichoic acid export membrane protein